MIKLDANENPYGPSLKTVAALSEMQAWHYYPDQEELLDALARYVSLEADNIVAGNGSDEVIDLVLRSALEPGEKIVDCPPSFQYYREAASASRVQVVQVPRFDDFSLDVEGVCRSVKDDGATVVLLASPNNPDGGLLPRSDLFRLLELPALIVMDEAYAEFAGETVVDLVRERPNLAVIRTFSKWAGLAGLRIGYAALPVPLADRLHEMRAPFNVNSAAVIAALASLQDRDYLMANVKNLVSERERMFSKLRQFAFLRPLPSKANFILCAVVAKGGRHFQEQLAACGVLVRAYETPRLSDYVRISIGRPEQNNALLAAIASVAGRV